MSNNKIEFAIITALQIELEAVLSKLGNYEEMTTPADALHFYLVNLGQAQVLVICSGPGNVAAARTATTVLERFHPASVLMVGIAAGFRRKVRLGDVVVAEACYYDGTGKDTATGKLSAPRQIPTGVLLGRSKAYKASDWRESNRNNATD